MNPFKPNFWHWLPPAPPKKEQLPRKELLAYIAELRTEMNACKRALKFKLSPRLPPALVLEGLKAVSPENETWRAVHSFLEEQIEIEKSALLVPSLENNDAQFNRGRLASLEDFREGLMQAWLRAQSPEA